MYLRRALLVALVVHLAAGHCVSAQERTDFPAEARERYEQGKDLQKNGQLDAAIRAFEEAIDLGMQAFPRVHLSRATSNLELQRYDAAIAQYTRFIDQFGLEKSCRY
jgi:outer membrane protein assembly factor BamD (BamD/ComL family)